MRQRGLRKTGSGSNEPVNVAQFETRMSQLEGGLGVLNDGSHQTQTISHGLNIINATEYSPVDVEIQGRTLVNLMNSNIEVSKKYLMVGANKDAIKMGKETPEMSGVSKIALSNITKANLAGKVAGSVVENPHKAHHFHGVTEFRTPNLFTAEIATNLDKLYIQDGQSAISGNSNQAVGGMAQHMFSFNVVEHIERKVGIIPGSSLGEKVQWVKDNVAKLTCNWYGYGIGPMGNKAYLKLYATNGNYYGAWSTTSDSMAKVSASSVEIGSYVQSDGFFHILVFTDPTDGVTFSYIISDYVELEIELKSTAQLAKPTYIRTANFEGKVSGSTVENPHIAKYNAYPSLLTPSGQWAEFSTQYTSTYYSHLYGLDGSNARASSPSNGNMAQHLFSFDIIAEVERNIGKIPAKDTAGKVQWVKDNVGRLSARWYGYGSSPTGNKATFGMWSVATSSWASSLSKSHNLGTVGQITTDDLGLPSARIDTSGFVHFLAYAEPADGTTASTITTDYVELKIELKPTADIHHPIVPLYELSTTEYDKALIEWNADELKRRYPRVQGMQHVQNPALIAEGENLLPPFYEWNVHAEAKALSPYELELNATGLFKSTHIKLSVLPNTEYTMSMPVIPNGYMQAVVRNDAGATITPYHTTLDRESRTFTTPADTKGYYFEITITSNAVGKFTFSNPMLTLGSQPKPFMPRNPSYMFSTAKLGALGTYKDTLFKQDGVWKIRKEIEKDVVLDGSRDWGFNSTFPGGGTFRLPKLDTNLQGLPSMSTKYDGKQLRVVNDVMASVPADSIRQMTPDIYLYINVSDSDSGLTAGTNTTVNNIKRYFNGWKYTDGTTWHSVTGNGQTATAQQALDTKPTDYTPYKLSYVLSTPKVETVQVEGDIAVNGATQVEVTSGIVVREKVTPQTTSTGAWTINEMGFWSSPDNPLIYKPLKILNIYKNTISDIHNWSDGSMSGANNGHWKYLESTRSHLFDPTATYYVTYTVFDRHLFTVNALDVKANYQKDIKPVMDDIVAKNSDNATQSSINLHAVMELYKRVKALGG